LIELKDIEESITLSEGSAQEYAMTEDYNMSHFDDFDSKSMDIKNF